MLQALKNGSKTFQALMNKVMWGAGVYANTHQDDTIITSDSFEEHLSHIRDVLERLRVANLAARASKTQFAREEIKCLRFMVKMAKVLLTLTRSRPLKLSRSALSRNQFWRFWGSRIITVDTLKIIVSEYFLSLKSQKYKPNKFQMNCVELAAFDTFERQ